MFTNETTLHLICGKIAAGKSSLAARLGSQPRTIVLSEDQWLAGLYRGEQTTLADYVRNAACLRTVIGPHVVALLRVGISVVLDFPANTQANRAWMRSLFETAGVGHQLHYLDVSDATCKARLHRRNAGGEHEFMVTDAQFDLITSHFLPPTADEGFNLIVHPDDDR